MSYRSWIYWLIVTLTLFALAQTAVATTPLTRIVGGNDAPVDQWQSTVALYLDLPGSTKSRFCAGTRVAPRWVLTTAHCLYDNAGKQDITPDRVGLISDPALQRRPESFQLERVANLYIHPMYRQLSVFDYDVALLELAYPSDQPTMPRLKNQVADDESVMVAGWGLSQLDADTGEPVPGSFAESLQQAELRIVSTAECQQTMEYRLTESMVCAGYDQGGRDSCLGDSGGPMVVERDGAYHQAGIVSFGNGCGEAGNFGVYTRLSEVNDWITQYTEIDAIQTVSDPKISLVKSETFERESPANTAVNNPRSSGGGGLLWCLSLPLLCAMLKKQG